MNLCRYGCVRHGQCDIEFAQRLLVWTDDQDVGAKILRKKACAKSTVVNVRV
jgi:hypothetical protein